MQMSISKQRQKKLYPGIKMTVMGNLVDLTHQIDTTSYGTSDD